MKKPFTGAQLQIKGLLACAVIASAGTSLPANAKPQFIIFDPPGSVATTSRVISNGNAAGYYQDGAGLYHGFVRTNDGVITSFDVAGASNTYAGSIDEVGRITGFYTQG